MQVQVEMKEKVDSKSKFRNYTGVVNAFQTIVKQEVSERRQPRIGYRRPVNH